MILFYVCRCFVFMYMHCVHASYKETGRGRQIPWNWTPQVQLWDRASTFALWGTQWKSELFYKEKENGNKAHSREPNWGSGAGGRRKQAGQLGVDTCEPPCGFWESNPKLPLVTTEPSFQPHNCHSLVIDLDASPRPALSWEYCSQPSGLY